MELKEGMYVRYRYYNEQKIGKIEFIKQDERLNDDFIGLTNDNGVLEGNVLKASNNLINLIEEGDYVNGVEVIGKEFDNFNKEYLQCGVGDYVICTFEVKDIKTILTKEQFESQKYIVESE